MNASKYKIFFFGFVTAEEPETVTFTINATTNNYVVDDGADKYFALRGLAGKTLSIDWGDGNNSVVTLNGSEQRFPKTYTTAGTYNVVVTGWNYVRGIRWHNWDIANFDFSKLPTYLESLRLFYITGITDNLSNLPSGISEINLQGLGVSGTFSNLTATRITLANLPTVSGSIDNLSPQLKLLAISNIGELLSPPGGVVSGSLDNLPADIDYILLSNVGNNVDISRAKSWANTQITITPEAGAGYTTAQIDQFLNSYAAVAGYGIKAIDLRGGNQSRSTASNSAVATLQSLGKIIFTN